MMMWPLLPMPPPPIARRSMPRAARASASVARPPGSFFSSTTNWLAIGPPRDGLAAILAPGCAGRPWYGRPMTSEGRTDVATEVIDARASDLSEAVADALDRPPEPDWIEPDAAGLRFVARTWGDPDRPALLLLHGVTASSRTWWRVGPALAVGLGRRVVAPDLPGHGRTGSWTGHHRFRDNAADVAAFAVAAGIATPDLRIVGHSWG